MARWDRNRALPDHCYARGNQIWFRYKDESGKWKQKKTQFTVDQVEQAERYVKSALNAIEKRKSKGAPVEYLTVRAYAERWLKDREARDIDSAPDDRRWLEKYALPTLGDLKLEDFRPYHVRNLVRALEARKGDQKMAPRSILHVYSTLHNMFENAVVDEILLANPVKMRRGELPKKVDKDPEWRLNATYTTHEVERLISDPVIPPERRVQYALKAIAGLRHGEVAALRWRHIDHSYEPLGKLKVVHAYNSRKKVVKRPKNEEPRDVPIHPTLAKILAAWKLMWANVYGRHLTDDDFVVPTRTFRSVAGKDACEAMLRDFATLGLRDKAGKTRNRGGHDLRSWYLTRAVEDGADFLIIRRTTHAAPKGVNDLYERFSWEAICREVSKLKVSVLDGKVLELATSSLHAQKKAGARWTSLVTPKGLESGEVDREDPRGSHILDGEPNFHGSSRAPSRATVVARLATELEHAIKDSDLPRALEITRRLRKLDAAAAPAAQSRQAGQP